MKTAVSIPDDLFREAERFAKDHRMSRSELVAKALRQYLHRQPGPWITEEIDRAIAEGKLDTSIDPALVRAQSEVLKRENW